MIKYIYIYDQIYKYDEISKHPSTLIYFSVKKWRTWSSCFAPDCKDLGKDEVLNLQDPRGEKSQEHTSLIFAVFSFQ